MKVLVTGFEPFGGETINPSWEAVKELPDKIENAEIIKHQLPVTFKGVKEKLPKIIDEIEPNVVILTGQAGGRVNITVERVAINVMDARMEDNEGYKPEDEPIFENAPAAYFATIPVKRIVNALRENKIPAMVSNSAGTYVCNTAMYTALHHIAIKGLDTKAGFIHVPYIPEQVLEKPQPSMSIEMIRKAIEIAIKESIKS
ncbi:MAG: pyroglutamyl-peptidase [Thermococcaceae archaeon]|jgi:pyroglutamyl-peptidase|uniref:pyroglutamyl-peptidase I n=1 Tax=Thermococcus TaxID=2263 RepID=UPI0005B29B76|nr:MULTISPECIES: pyroglutamyl-peptidase I [Thermococcus]MDK2782497.1 pyroglutamyl-peptidase [Thermococcaceae archaeon]MCA6214452.1 pyroglutamyl-peptidase I [Thermococcus bergensis]MDK2853694.1 pyroglutamyl-peptidase [Thermococcaceae archaeon]MDK2983857.1 pyroglutamyl-peptidase [Thermococcaceae archaeon]MDN5320348.1 pyroglutamyl-peptidase [Thermococcaceae archaeon]